MVEPGLIASLSIAALGGVVWAVRIEGRVNGHQTLFEEREKQFEDRHGEIQARLIRIENKLDRYEASSGRKSITA